MAPLGIVCNIKQLIYFTILHFHSIVASVRFFKPLLSRCFCYCGNTEHSVTAPSVTNSEKRTIIRTHDLLKNTAQPQAQKENHRKGTQAATRRGRKPDLGTILLGRRRLKRTVLIVFSNGFLLSSTTPPSYASERKDYKPKSILSEPSVAISRRGGRGGPAMLSQMKRASSI